MQKLIFTLSLIFAVSSINAQDMDNEKLHAIFYTISDQIEGENGNWRFSIDSLGFMCLTDELHNRMRIMSPVLSTSDMSEEEIKKCLEANFHTALDARYAISDDILWAAYIHPLKELTKEQVISGITQVYSCVKTFGTYYSSGILSFPTSEERKAGNN